ncbi:hypothetical protein ACH2GS_001538 [Acinetobacter baumannii]|nr:hypothetical protein [Acinetobacter baumannii]EKW1221094.1 hypothetical protein [Acinetobacter baumannii]ELB0339139.1 hypothetical protein [Acinetobacter baumannii]ELN4151247.1 hypothetical protein [Acinetobacter baumannii]
MDNQQLLMFKGWFIDSYPECKDYLDLTYFDVEKSSFIAKCSYNPDSGIAAKVLRIAFGSWQHQQAKVEELQKRVDAVKGLIEDLNKCYQQDHQNKFEYWRGFADSAGILGKRLEQALKGEG